jgi:hypothetical protein
MRTFSNAKLKMAMLCVTFKMAAAAGIRFDEMRVDSN